MKETESELQQSAERLLGHFPQRLLSRLAALDVFVREIADDDYYSSGADRTDVQRAARELLTEVDEM